jgi:hypothetical protein
MSILRHFVFSHAQARQRACDYAEHEAPEGCEVIFQKPRRNSEQNAKFHALCRDLAKSDRQWAGKRRSLEEWKVLLISGHSVATKQGAEMVLGLEGEFLNIRESTARMSKARMSSLIEYAQAFVAEEEV